MHTLQLYRWSIDKLRTTGTGEVGQVQIGGRVASSDSECSGLARSRPAVHIHGQGPRPLSTENSRPMPRHLGFGLAPGYKLATTEGVS